mgnify:CR=1 FL=1
MTAVFGYDADAAKAITKKAKPKYREIISELPEFEKGDRFKMNLVNCAMIGAFILSMPEHPDVERLTEYYAKSMMTKPMKWFCRKSGKNKFTPKDIAGMKATAALRAADRNPYSWNMELYEYPDGSGYEGRFTKCGICVLMQKLGLYDLTPALCRLDCTMSEAGGVTDFVRQYNRHLLNSIYTPRLNILYFIALSKALLTQCGIKSVCVILITLWKGGRPINSLRDTDIFKMMEYFAN